MFGTLKKVMTPRGISGYESQVCETLMQLMVPYTDKTYTDPMGSLIAYKKGTGDEDTRKKIMLVAHMDEIGFLVTAIEDNGYIRTQPIGYIDYIAAAYSTVAFQSGIHGVIVPETGTAPGDIRADKTVIDIGAENKSQASRVVSVGDYCALDFELVRLTGKKVAGRPLDDRVGCAVLVEIAKKLCENPCRDDVYFVFSVQEEVGMRGAGTAAFGINPDIGLAYDVTGTGDTVGARPMACRVGGGAAIKIKDSSVLCNRQLVRELAECAEREQIKYQYEILAAGGTDTATVQTARAGVTVGAISIPTRYIHSGTEVCDLKDAEACVDLTVAWLRSRE